MSLSDAARPASRRIDVADWAITVALLALMAAAYAAAASWPRNAAFFPQMVSGTSVILLLVKLGNMAWKAGRPVPSAAQPVAAVAPAPAREAADDREIVIAGSDDDEEGDEDELNASFSNASQSSWMEAVGWLAAFFAALWAFGLLVTLPVFTVLYLRFVAKTSWLTCLLYVLGTSGLIYVLFVLTLHLPLPEGALVTLGG